MSWVAPLYLAGLLAVAAPIVFHLWRRTPQGRREFPTLMFLRPSPPRMTRLSKIEHWLLLCLRALAVLLIALAFSRPVWRIPSVTPTAQDDSEYLAILIDVSGSMERTGLLDQLRATVRKKLESLPDPIIPALFAFDDRWVPLVTFEESEALQPPVRKALLLERLSDRKTTPHGTDLGEALVRTAQALQEAQSGRVVPRPQRIWLVSDLQAGSRLAALRAFDWPGDIPVEAEILRPKEATNAGVQLVAAALDAADQRLRVRVTNDATSLEQRFALHWGASAKSETTGELITELLVPPGQSRVVALPEPNDPAAGQLVELRGDAHPFDNRLWLPRRTPRPVTVLYSGTDAADDPQGLRFYLEQALGANPLYQVTLAGPEATTLPELIIASRPSALTGVLGSHQRVILVPETAAALQELVEAATGQVVAANEATGQDYALWSAIDFESPWFAPFAEAQFADFSGIHFWKHRRIREPIAGSPRTLVRFDDNDPAILEWTLESRKVWLFTSGWQPADSQLSRSTKFVPLVWRMLEHALGDRPSVSATTIGEPLPVALLDQAATIKQPDGQSVNWEPASPLPQAEQAGLYEMQSGTERATVAVNLPPEESRTDPLQPEQLEAYGVRWSEQAQRPTATAPTATQLRQQQLRELEERQQLWRWGVLAALGFLALESWAAVRRGTGVASAEQQERA